MGGLLIVAWILLAIATGWWFLVRNLEIVDNVSVKHDPDAAKIRDFLRAFSEWDHGGRPG